MLGLSRVLAILLQIALPLFVAALTKFLPDQKGDGSAPVVISVPKSGHVTTPPPTAVAAAPARPASADLALPPPGDIAPASCLRRFQMIGLPYQVGDDAAAKEVLVCRRGYALGYDGATHDPDWVIEHITASDLTGTATRAGKFRQDPALANHDATLADYKAADAAGQHFDRGHQAPAADAKFNQTVMNQSFYMTNMTPQIGIGFNRGAWAYLENIVRSWVLCGGHPELYIITGPIYPDNIPDTIGTDKVIVPQAFFKIVYDPASNRAIGFLLKHQKIGSKLDNLQDYVVPITKIEGETGLSFFRNLDVRTQSLLKDQAGTAWAHIGTCDLGTGN